MTEEKKIFFLHKIKNIAQKMNGIKHLQTGMQNDIDEIFNCLNDIEKDIDDPV